MPQALRAFRHRNFRLFCVGQAISLIGTWIHQIALAWLVYRTTGSGFLLGLATFCNQVPLLVVMPFAGLLSDRYDRRKILISAHAPEAGQALAESITHYGATNKKNGRPKAPVESRF